MTNLKFMNARTSDEPMTKQNSFKRRTYFYFATRSIIDGLLKTSNQNGFPSWSFIVLTLPSFLSVYVLSQNEHCELNNYSFQYWKKRYKERYAQQKSARYKLCMNSKVTSIYFFMWLSTNYIFLIISRYHTLKG